MLGGVTSRDFYKTAWVKILAAVQFWGPVGAVFKMNEVTGRYLVKNGNGEYVDSSGTPTPIVAEFVGVPLTGAAPLEVTFTNQSNGDIDSFRWAFGDGEHSGDIDPVHTYVAADSYTVQLHAFGAEGESIKTKIAYIEVT